MGEGGAETTEIEALINQYLLIQGAKEAMDNADGTHDAE